MLSCGHFFLSLMQIDFGWRQRVPSHGAAPSLRSSTVPRLTMMCMWRKILADGRSCTLLFVDRTRGRARTAPDELMRVIERLPLGPNQKNPATLMSASEGEAGEHRARLGRRFCAASSAYARVITDVAIFPVRGRRRKCADARR